MDALAFLTIPSRAEGNPIHCLCHMRSFPCWCTNHATAKGTQPAMAGWIYVFVPADYLWCLRKIHRQVNLQIWRWTYRPLSSELSRDWINSIPPIIHVTHAGWQHCLSISNELLLQALYNLIHKNTHHYCFMFSTLHSPDQQHNSVSTVDFYLK